MSTNKIGPTFHDELAAAGVSFEGLVWNTITGEITATDDEHCAAAEAVFADHDPTKQLPPEVPDGPTLGDWRVALHLWGRLPDVLSRIEDLIATGDPMGGVVKERVEYSNHVFRAELLLLKDAMGFTEADVDESLYRANQVSLGDLSGVWAVH